MGKYDIKASNRAQEEYCLIQSLPHFAPSSGVCWSCKKNIYTLNGNSGISVEMAGQDHITGCPHCRRTFLD